MRALFLSQFLGANLPAILLTPSVSPSKNHIFCSSDAYDLVYNRMGEITNYLCRKKNVEKEPFWLAMFDLVCGQDDVLFDCLLALLTLYTNLSR